MTLKPLIGLTMGLTLVACASTPEITPGLPSLVANPGQPAPANAAFIIDCLTQAIAARTYDRDSDPDTELLRFACSGPPARAFYDALADRSVAEQSELVGEGRTWRFTERLIRDPFGADGCSTDGRGDYRCVINLNVGGFLTD